MSAPQSSLPHVRPLPDDFSIERAFGRVSTQPGCVWFDSASRGPVRRDQETVGRYSFLTADPVATLSVTVDDSDPWPTLDQWCRQLPSECDPSLPPFQGGIAGLIGYEAASWLEPVGLARCGDLPTPAISVGLYDWTIATDHHTGKSWIISQGLSHEPVTTEQRLERAITRADRVEAFLGTRKPIPMAVDTPDTNQALDPAIFDRQFESPLEGVRSNFADGQFRGSVAEIVRSIRAGDSFQVNLAQRLLKVAELPPQELYLRLRRCNPAPFSAYFNGVDFQVLSSSPEGFLKVRGREVETRPIKGTIHRTGDPAEDAQLASQLESSEKDRAENIMIVDLMRNDLSRVCIDESVVVRQLCEVEQYEFVQHLVSVVEGRLGDGNSTVDLLRACFPGGSVTGAPKIEAMRSIARLEPNRRGPYCGSIGYVGCGGNSDFNILIRTITAAGGYWQIPVGGGITARSDPKAEEAETWAKAEGMLRAVNEEIADLIP